MNLRIEKATNGIVLTYNVECDDSDWGSVSEQIVFEIDDDDLIGLKNFHSTLDELLGYSGSRYDDKRLYHVLAPGDKNDKFTDNHLNILFSND